MRFLAEAESCVAKRNRPTGNQAIHKLLNYIQEHYAEPLNLTEVAHHFHFNPSYLSNYFATHNKEGFSEYLNRVRIDKACELLKNSDMSISEVSGQVGYSDPSYFTKVFRKLKNISPSQYRKYVQEGQDPE
nr:helix-turn-helix domain-containing protein [Paenibacillus phyllosphaerae]